MWCKKVRYLKYSHLFANIFINVIDLDIREIDIKINFMFSPCIF